MSSSQTLPEALHTWMHAFMRNSMCNFYHNAHELGVSVQQFGALFYLRRTGNCGVSDMGENLGVTSAAASQMIERLVQQGLLERSENPRDRRLKQIVLTSRGRELIEASLRERQSWIEELSQRLTPEQQEAVIASLDLLTIAAQELDCDNAPQAA